MRRDRERGEIERQETDVNVDAMVTSGREERGDKQEEEKNRQTKIQTQT